MIKNIPELDPKFKPFEAFIREFLKTANKPISIAIERNDGLTSLYDTYIHGTSEKADEDFLYIERLVKFLLWSRGGHKIIVCGDKEIADRLKETYANKGERDFDYHFMGNVYEKSFTVESRDLEDKPAVKENPQKIGRHLDGCPIGFDAGGSDRKVSAVINGESVYSEEVVWFPKLKEDPEYHYSHIVEALKTAASKMPRVDAIGVSSAGIYIDNHARVASLFIKIPKENFDKKVKDIYIRAAKEIGDVPLVVANDGDVTALAGSMSLNDNNILGIAMGTSEAVGYIDKDGNITGWLNELAFAPVDLSPDAEVDEWSFDRGVGCKYFSQDAVIKLAPAAGIDLDPELSLAEKLKVVQELMEKDDPRAAAIYRSIGCYLGHTIPLYARFYDIKHVLLMGRVTSGKGGSIIIDTANNVMSQEYPEISKAISLQLPSEKSRRVGQSIAAASLPKI
jgi:predicted NBD/HSP70 family sugar kinase